MHAFTAATILTRQAMLDILRDGGPVVVNVEQKIGTYLSDQQCDAIMAALATLEHEIAVGSDQEITEAHRVITDQAYAAQEAPEVDG